MIKRLITILFLISISFNIYADQKNVDESFWPMFDNISKVTGKKDTLEIFAPKNSLMYQYIKDKPEGEDFYKWLGKTDFTLMLNSKKYQRSLYPEMSTIKNINYSNSGVFITIDVKNSSEKIVQIKDPESIYTVIYQYGHGYVVSAKINIEYNPNDYNETGDYLRDKINTAIEEKGYQYRWFNRGYINKNIDSVVSVERFYKVVIVNMYSIDTSDNYSDITESIRKQDLDIQYATLNKVFDKTNKD